MSKTLLYRIAPWILPLAILAAWQGACSAGAIPAAVFPSPVDVIRAAISLWQKGELQQNLLISTARAVSGFMIGGLFGFALGIFNGVSRFCYAFFDSLVQMIRAIPHLSLLPLVIIWFGVAETGKVFLVVLGVFFPIYINTLAGIRGVSRDLMEMGQVYGLGRVRLFTQIIFPGALPSIMVGVRYALGNMWISLIVAETVAANSGIGYMAMNAREFMQLDVIVLSVVLYALLGKISDSIAKFIERHYVSWYFNT